MQINQPSNKKRGGICIYYKKHPPVIKRDDLYNLNECLVLEIRIGEEKCFFCIYVDHQVKVERNLKVFVPTLIYSPACSIITGNFNARSTEWWKLDKEILKDMK